MLLDTYSLKSGLESLPSLSDPTIKPPPPPPSSYVKRINQAFNRLTPILKTLQVRPSPPEALVQAYLIHIADKSDTNFRKILDLKGLKRQDQTHLLELFQAHKTSPKNAEHLAQSSPTLTPLTVGGSGGLGIGIGGGVSTTSVLPGGAAVVTGGLGALSSSAASLSTGHLPARFDPTTLGSAIMTAARDGVDRIGSGAVSSLPSGSASISTSGAGGAGTGTPDYHHNTTGSTSTIPAIVGTGSAPGDFRMTSPPPPQFPSFGGGARAMSPDPTSASATPRSYTNPGIATPGTATSTSTTTAAGNLNENLRNIGKFFRRDLGGFGGRFGSGGGSSGSGGGGGSGAKGSWSSEGRRSEDG